MTSCTDYDVDSIGADRIVRDGLGQGTNRDCSVCEDER